MRVVPTQKNTKHTWNLLAGAFHSKATSKWAHFYIFGDPEGKLFVPLWVVIVRHSFCAVGPRCRRGQGQNGIAVGLRPWKKAGVYEKALQCGWSVEGLAFTYSNLGLFWFLLSVQWHAKSSSRQVLSVEWANTSHDEKWLHHAAWQVNITAVPLLLAELHVKCYYNR